MYKFGVLTVSDRVFNDSAVDISGPTIAEILKKNFSNCTIETSVLPDEAPMITELLKMWSDKDNMNLILTTGGTGFAPRDVTPEATQSILERFTPGITTRMFTTSLAITPHAMLSRAVSGIRGKTLIVNLPGSVKGAKENLEAILAALPHALQLINGVPSASSPTAHNKLNKDTESLEKEEKEEPHRIAKSYSEGLTKPHAHSHSHSHSELTRSHSHSHNHKTERSQFNSDTTHTHSHSHSHSHDRHSCGNGIHNSPYEMFSVEKALSVILENTAILTPQSIPSQNSLGYILAEDVFAKDPLPPFRASIKDGYAVIASDGEGVFPLVGVVTAGQIPPFEVTEGKLARITTGSAVPNGANAIVMVEYTEIVQKADGEHKQEMIKILKGAKPGQDIRAIGSDVAVGQLILNKGTLIGASEVGLLATVGVSNVKVFPMPKVAILSSGDELVEANEANLPPGKIRDSNLPMLVAAVNALSRNKAEIKNLGIGKDEKESLEKIILDGVEHSNIIISSGGVSMGELDLIKPLLEKLGTVHFGRVSMKPGKPLTFATVPKKDGSKALVFALPGNPVSSLVCFYLFAIPAFRKMAGFSNPFSPEVEVMIDRPIALDPERPEYHRAIVKWDFKNHCYVASSTGSQISCRLLSMQAANALLVMPQRKGTLEEGSFVKAILILD
eukprot:TRINITY_DN4545_c0_g4_i2.p1 TRINITY_DN4545_c0_g4~~TRINITY_DN4545_c0_g4_i2.p1  ORF type:complete len:673 (+),score=129.84 TRINITY_DN4545_c0_g4_i2:2215-4233(+)